MISVHRLLPSHAARFQAVRLRGLREAPTAFGASYEEECDQPVTAVAERLATHRDGFILGAFDDDTLVGVVGMQRDRHAKMRHKMVLWGMYVVPEARGGGVGRRLVEEALRQAFATAGVLQVSLGVNAANAPALALYHATGFVSFGLEHGFMIVNGVLQDEVHMVCARPA